MDGHDEGRIRIFGPAPIRKTLEIKSSRRCFLFFRFLIVVDTFCF